MGVTVSTSRGPGAGGPGRRIRRRMPGRAGACLAVAAAGAMTAAAALTAAAPAGAAASGPAASGAAVGGAGVRGPQAAASAYSLRLRAMPRGTVSFGRRAGRLTVHAVMAGLTPGSQHGVHLLLPGHAGAVRFSTLAASAGGSARATLRSHFAGPLPRGSRLVIRMGTGDGRVARKAIAQTRLLRGGGRGPHRLFAVEIGRGGASWGTPRGRADISYNAQRGTLTVTVQARGLTPGPHAAHIHLGSCQSQGPVKYMLPDLVANRHGRIAHAVRVFTHVTAPIPAHGWYLNIHQGNSGDILRNGQPTIFFRPLLCANIRGSGSISQILRGGDVVTGVRGTGKAGDVVLTGSAATGNGAQAQPFLYRGALAKAAGAAVSVRTPPFREVTSATFYGPDTHTFNPVRIPAGQVRAVGSYQSSAAPAGVINQGMIYLGPVSGPGGSWRSIDVPADGAHTTGHLRACPRRRPHCFVMDTIAHSTMGNLVVGNYDLKPAPGGGVASGNAFVYNLDTRRWTLLRLGGSLSSQTSLYGIWQDGGPGSPHYTLAGGSAASGHKRAFLMDYNERTGRFGAPRYYSYGNRPEADTHFEGITAVPGGFNLVGLSTAPAVAMAFVPVHRNGALGRATWSTVNVPGSALCSGGCSVVTGNTVIRNHVMGVYLRADSTTIRSYLAAVASR